ncbi:hypothetical protein MRX96_031248 [Rhipicephalus microplus]
MKFAVICRNIAIFRPSAPVRGTAGRAGQTGWKTESRKLSLYSTPSPGFREGEAGRLSRACLISQVAPDSPLGTAGSARGLPQTPAPFCHSVARALRWRLNECARSGRAATFGSQFIHERNVEERRLQHNMESTHSSLRWPAVNTAMTGEFVSANTLNRLRDGCVVVYRLVMITEALGEALFTIQTCFLTGSLSFVGLDKA